MHRRRIDGNPGVEQLRCDEGPQSLAHGRTGRGAHARRRPPCGFGMQHSLFRPAPAKRPGNPERQVAGWDFMGLRPVIPHEVNDITDYAQES